MDINSYKTLNQVVFLHGCLIHAVLLVNLLLSKNKCDILVTSQFLQKRNFQNQTLLEFRFRFWLGWFTLINNLIII
jgi:hypothetical protein